VGIAACKLAGEVLRERFNTTLSVTYKGRGNFTTDADHAAERAVITLLREEFPSAGILAEESAPNAVQTEWQWVIDPLDGTRNFSTGVPYFCTIVALAHRGEVVLGMTYDPMRDELFTGERGAGAELNGKPMQVRQSQTLEECTIGFDLGYDNDKARRALRLIEHLWPGMQTIRIMGSCGLGLAYVAAGRTDLYFHHALSPWDIAAGLVQVPEAGGVFTDKHGMPATLRCDGLIVANSALHQAFLKATANTPWRTGAG
jgi:fructose-1,6-bisphosphatase/inositol monophosphatase family enzyme